MPSTQTPGPSELQSAAERLERQVSDYKSTISRTRRRLHEAMAELADLRRRCSAMGIQLSVVETNHNR